MSPLDHLDEAITFGEHFISEADEDEGFDFSPLKKDERS
jgi:hypothetical protein